jgi:hypothetical protein
VDAARRHAAAAPPPNAPPAVSLTAPSNGASFSAPATITIAASAADSDGSVAQVERYPMLTMGCSSMQFCDRPRCPWAKS